MAEGWNLLELARQAWRRGTRWRGDSSRGGRGRNTKGVFTAKKGPSRSLTASGCKFPKAGDGASDG